MNCRPMTPTQLVEATGDTAAAFPHDPSKRGYVPSYRQGEQNHCPGCGRSQWIVGRFSAECAFCQTALPFQEGRR